MSTHKQSLSIAPPASTVLPPAKVIQLEPNKRTPSIVSKSFTKNNINQVRCPPGKREAFFWDASCRGFGIRVLQSGRRSWVFQYRDENSRTRRATRLHDAGIEPLVVEALLAHKQQGVAAVYNRASFWESKCSALTRWHEILTGVVG